MNQTWSDGTFLEPEEYTYPSGSLRQSQRHFRRSSLPGDGLK